MEEVGSFRNDSSSSLETSGEIKWLSDIDIFLNAIGTQVYNYVFELVSFLFEESGY